MLNPVVSGSNTFTTLEQLTPELLASIGVRRVDKTVVLNSMIAVDPALEKVEGVAVAGRFLTLTADNDFNLVGVDPSTSPASIVLNEVPNLPKVITIPLP